MGVEGCAKFIKYAMFLFNFLIFIGGAALLGVGIWVAVDTTGATAILTAFLGSTLYSSAAYILIVCGAIILIIGFLGCCGAIKESKCMLGTFFALMLLIFIILLVGAILAFVFRDTVTSVLKSEMESSLADKYGKTDDTAITQAWDSAQELFKCCGVSGNFTSMTSWYLYQNSSWYAGQPNNASRVMVPASCCKKEKNVFTDQAKCQGTTPVANSPPVSPPGTAGLKENPDMYGSGCYDVTYSNVMSNAIILGAIAIAILVVMMVAMILSCCLCRSIKTKYHE
ncbi:tetraspanin-18-like isoform X2 [Lineus longissimus]|uniref:tetraspanin-18-like isoform X2 n=1 Tax=Lineus longissimus TaxID=88925 RepID=UPI00315C8D04